MHNTVINQTSKPACIRSAAVLLSGRSLSLLEPVSTLSYKTLCSEISDRNLSSAKQSSRQAMRKCRGLVDSLVRYLGDCVEEGKPDDKVGNMGSMNICF